MSIKTVSSTAAFILLCIVGVSAQTVNPAKLRIKGVGLDSTYAQVLSVLGRPRKETKPISEECIGGHEKTVEYPGLSFYLMDGDSRGGKTFEVKGFEMSSGTWNVSGIKIGDTEETVRQRLGRKFTVEKDVGPGTIAWGYDMGDKFGPGTTYVHFKNRRVVSIISNYMVC